MRDSSFILSKYTILAKRTLSTRQDEIYKAISNASIVTVQSQLQDML